MKQVDKAFQRQRVNVSLAGPAYAVLGYEHWLVCVDHELRAMGLRKGVLAGTLRAFFGTLVEGTWVDEYRNDEGRLLAWSAMVAKGKTMRCMWFYQRTEASKHLIWFYSLRLAVARAIALGLHHLDLGPSNSPNVVQLKAKYGFKDTLYWNKLAYEPATVLAEGDDKKELVHVDEELLSDYSGPFIDLSCFKHQDKLTVQPASDKAA